MTGKISEIEMSAILISLKIKSETKEEILGATLCMREKSLKINTRRHSRYMWHWKT